MLLSTLLTISILASPQELSIEKSKVTPREVVAFNGVVVSIEKESVRALEVDQTVVVNNFPLGMDGEVNLRLQQFDVFIPDAEIVLGSVNYLGDAVHRQKEKPDVVLLRGTIEGDPSSKVFLALGEHTTNGLIETEGKTYVLAKSKTAGWSAIYNLNNVDPEDMHWGDFYCDVIDTGKSVLKRGPYAAPVANGVCQALQIAVDTDWEFVELFDGSVDAASEYAATLFGAMSTIYESDLNVQTQISYLRIWNDASDPWDQQLPFDQLNQFRSYWEANMDSANRHLAHLLSGRNLGGGIAWLNGVCTTYGYALSTNLLGSFPLPLEDNNSNNWDIYVVAHETGHNCGSSHTHEYSPKIDYCGEFGHEDRCESANDGTLMSYCHQCPGGMSNISLQFHSIVQGTIENYLASSVTCSLACETVELMGACCNDQTCAEVLEEDCTETGGVYFGDGTICLNNVCVPLHGACCLGELGFCTDDGNLSQCNVLDGIYLGNGTSCDSGWCNPDLPAACCFDDACNDLLEDECDELGGSRLGLGIFCSENVCILVDNDTCETARLITSGSWTFSTEGASSGGPAPDSSYCEGEYLGDMYNDVWFKYEACEEDLIEVSTCSSVDFDTDLIIYTYDGLDCNDIEQFACNGDFPDCNGFTSRVTFSTTQGQVYLIRVGGFLSPLQGSGQLMITGQVCQTDIPCSGDVDFDGIVGVNDLLEIISHWLSEDPVDIKFYDVDENGMIDIGDILFIIAHWGCDEGG